MNALRAETGALAKLVERETAEGGQILDQLQVNAGFEKALGAALADDLRAPQVSADGPSGWAVLPGYDADQALPAGIVPLSQHVTVPPALIRRISQIGLVDADEGPGLQAALKPGQRLVSLEGDLWRWDGFRAWAEDAPSAAALRLQQLNRLEELKQSLEQATARADGARAAHDTLTARLADLTRADANAYRDLLLSRMAPNSVQRNLGVVKAAINHVLLEHDLDLRNVFRRSRSRGREVATLIDFPSRMNSSP